MSKNRRLLEDLTKLRVSWEDLSGEHARSADTIDGLQADVVRQRSLVERLENDLAQIHKSGEAERSASTSAAQGLAGLDIGKPVS